MYLSNIKEEATALCAAPGGPALLCCIGTVYLQVAKQHGSKYFGMQKITYKFKEIKYQVNLLHALSKTAVELNQAAKADTATSNDHIESLGLRAAWQTGLMEIDMLLRQSCKRAVLVHNVVSKQRVAAIEQIGRALLDVAKMHGITQVANVCNMEAPTSPPQSPPTQRQSPPTQRPQAPPRPTSPPSQRAQPAAASLPFGWAIEHDDFGRTVYISPYGQAQYERPRHLPDGWTEASAPNGLRYFISPAGTTQWELPAQGGAQRVQVQ